MRCIEDCFLPNGGEKTVILILARGIRLTNDSSLI